MLSSNFISKSLVKCLHLETNFNIRKFVFWYVAIFAFSFKQKLHLSIARFTRAHLRTIFKAISALLLIDLRIHTSFKNSVLQVLILLAVKWFFMTGESFFKSGFKTFLVIFFVIIKFIWVQTGLINNIFDVTFFD